jgi:hypothetical protein
MSNARLAIFSATMVAVYVLGFAHPTQAQISWLRPESNNSITLQVLKVSLSESEQVAASSSLWFMSGRFLIGRDLHLIMELPVSYFSYSNYVDLYGYGRSKSETMIGNPYFGLEFGGNGSSGILSIGGRVPLASDSKPAAGSLGMLGTFDRAEGFAPDVFAVAVASGYRYVSASGVTLKGVLGPTYLLNSSGRGANFFELWADYHAELLIRTGIFTPGIGFSGRFLLARKFISELSFTDRMVNQFGLALTIDARRFRPGLHLQVPLKEEYRNVVDLVYGLTLTVNLD